MPADDGGVRVRGARQHNLAGVDVAVPLEGMGAGEASSAGYLVLASRAGVLEAHLPWVA